MPLRRLNLSIANRIHILEPQWNPAVESQAIGRVLRLGQEKEVTIVRYITRNTVEEVMSPTIGALKLPSHTQFQYVQSRQSRKLQFATVGWGQRGEEENQEEQEMKKILVCIK
jgi:SWI/SNF-related matrix-associated actin-dependent regulator of chromatin subfamily A3